MVSLGWLVSALLSLRKAWGEGVICIWTGNTPLVRIASLSDALGIEIFGKCEVRRGVIIMLVLFAYCDIVFESRRKCQGPSCTTKSGLSSSNQTRSHAIDVAIDDAERQGLIHPHTGSRLFEGTVGSTGISLATLARARYV